MRQWLEENATPVRGGVGEGAAVLDRDVEKALVAEARVTQRALFDAGLAGLTWPVAYGGQGLDIDHHRVFWEEAATYDLGSQFFMIAFGTVGPTLMQIGSEAQKRRFIPAMLRGEETWCQLFSEPNAGSDVASLQTRASQDDDGWLINGQKVWTSGAHRANRGALLARTDPDQPKHQGITMFIVNMNDPGVEVRPLRQATGDAPFNEVFFENVRVTAEDVIGEVNGGWRAATTMLMNERVAIGTMGERRVGGGEFESLRALATGNRLNADPVIRQKLVGVYISERILGFLAAQVQAARRAGREPGAGGSVAKLSRALLAGRVGAVGAAIAGAHAQAWPADSVGSDRWARAAMSMYVLSIGGGTNEIQRNILGERILGLPREPQVDGNVPFRELVVGTQRAG